MQTLHRVCLLVLVLTLLSTGCENKPEPEKPAKPDPHAQPTPQEQKAKPEKPNEQTLPAPEQPGVTPTEITIPPAQTSEVTLQVVTHEQYEKIVSAFKGKVVVIDFWGTWCKPCVRDFPQTVAMREKYPVNDVIIMSMAIDGLRLKNPEDPQSTDLESPEDLKASVLQFLQEKKALFPNMLAGEAIADSPFEAFNAYGIEVGLPHFKIYGRDGKIFKTFPETFDQEVTHKMIEDAVQQALDAPATN